MVGSGSCPAACLPHRDDGTTREVAGDVEVNECAVGVGVSLGHGGDEEGESLAVSILIVGDPAVQAHLVANVEGFKNRVKRVFPLGIELSDVEAEVDFRRRCRGDVDGVHGYAVQARWCRITCAH